MTVRIIRSYHRANPHVAWAEWDVWWTTMDFRQPRLLCKESLFYWCSLCKDYLAMYAVPYLAFCEHVPKHSFLQKKTQMLTLIFSLRKARHLSSLGSEFCCCCFCVCLFLCLWFCFGLFLFVLFLFDWLFVFCCCCFFWWQRWTKVYI